MNALIVFDTMRYGGIQKVGLSYAKMLKELGFEIDILILNRNTEDIIKEFEKIGNIKVFHLPQYYFNDFYFRLINKKNYGIWILPIAYLIIGALNYIVKFFLRIKYKKSFDLAIAFSGHINDLSIIAKKYIKAKYTIAWVHGARYSYYLLSNAYHKLYKKIKNIVVLSTLCEEDCNNTNKEELNIRKIYNPINIREVNVNKHLTDKIKMMYGDDFILSVGRLDKDKDQETILKAMKYIKDKYNFTKNVVFVGDGCLKNQLIDIANKLGLNENVFFVGNRDDVNTFYCAAKIFVHSSPVEGLPTVLLEAMIFNLPIISTNSMPGVSEILENGKYGNIVDVKDYKSLGEYLYKFYLGDVLNDIDYHKRLKDFDYNIIKNKFEDFLSNLK